MGTPSNEIFKFSEWKDEKDQHRAQWVDEKSRVKMFKRW